MKLESFRCEFNVLVIHFFLSANALCAPVRLAILTSLGLALGLRLGLGLGSGLGNMPGLMKQNILTIASNNL